MNDSLAGLTAALSDRYRVERELVAGGMASADHEPDGRGAGEARGEDAVSVRTGAPAMEPYRLAVDAVFPPSTA